MIVGSDILYHEPSIVPLLHTLLHASSDKTEIVLAVVNRGTYMASFLHIAQCCFVWAHASTASIELGRLVRYKAQVEILVMRRRPEGRVLSLLLQPAFVARGNTLMQLQLPRTRTPAPLLQQF